MRKDWGWRDTVFIGYVAFAVGSLGALGLFGWPAIYKFAKHPAVTAWLQALGAIGALAIAVWLQYRAGDARKRQVSSAVVAFMEQFLEAYSSWYTASEFENVQGFQSSRAMLEDLLLIGASLSIADMGDRQRTAFLQARAMASRDLEMTSQTMQPEETGSFENHLKCSFGKVERIYLLSTGKVAPERNIWTD